MSESIERLPTDFLANLNALVHDLNRYVPPNRPVPPDEAWRFVQLVAAIGKELKKAGVEKELRSRSAQFADIVSPSGSLCHAAESVWDEFQLSVGAFGILSQAWCWDSDELAWTFMDEIQVGDFDSESVKKLRELHWELRQQVQINHFWGCFLIVACRKAVQKSPKPNSELVDRLRGPDDRVLEAVRAAVIFLRSLLVTDVTDGKSMIMPPTTSAHPQESRAKRKAKLDLGHDPPLIHFGRKRAELKTSRTSRELKLITYLFQSHREQNPRLDYRSVFEAVYPNEDFCPDSKKGSPPKLRQLVRRANASLEQQLGPAPGTGRWIETIECFGFHLNREVHWQSAWDSIDQPLRGGITKQLRHDPEDSDLEDSDPYDSDPELLDRDDD